MNKLPGSIVASVQSQKTQLQSAPSLERRRLRAYIAMLLIDLILLHFGFVFAAFAYENVWWEPRAVLATAILLPIYFTIAFYNTSYCARSLTDWGYAVRKLAVALVISVGLLNFLAFFAKANAEFSRVSMSLGLILSFTLMALARRGLVAFIARFWGGKIRNYLVINDGGPAFSLRDATVIDAREMGLDPGSHDPHMRDKIGQLLRNQDNVVVSSSSLRRQQWAILLKSVGVFGEILSEPAQRIGAMGVQRYDAQDVTSLVVSTGPLGLRARAAKRCYDIALALAGLVLLSPVLAVFALLIKLEDGGPVLFAQRRVGRGNEFFNMLKFRSMRTESGDESGERSTARDDDRVTRIGRFIRSSSIDELPQLWNVLRGEMSIVGPRPHALGSQAGDKLFWEVDGQYWRRHSLKPGLTGLAQVRGHRGATEQESDLTDRLQSDLEYIAGWTLRRDVEITLRTLSVLRHDRAF